MGFDEQQLRVLKAQVIAKRREFHEIIDRAYHLAQVKSGNSSERWNLFQDGGGVIFIAVFQWNIVMMTLQITSVYQGGHPILTKPTQED